HVSIDLSRLYRPILQGLRVKIAQKPVIPAKAGIQHNMCLEEARYFFASVALKQMESCCAALCCAGFPSSRE
ncbi:MAG: hypothetical protein KBB83_08415, partial [Alphaproteobacteria bacterium]|nr:hypothetical protein [Alphaproteobacteria bacterium]